MSRILLTGATGFIGQSLAYNLNKKGYSVRAAIRNKCASTPNFIDRIHIPVISSDTDWKSSLIDVDTVIHLAARVHITSDSSHNPLEEFRSINTYGTLNLAKQAVALGVKRFIYLSSIKVNNTEATFAGERFLSDKAAMSHDPYALSKYEAEQGLLDFANKTQMEVVIIRPPLVYGPGVKANFFNMMKWLYKGVPLPFGAIHNKRSFVSLDNLVDLICTCIDHPAAANQVFLVSDGEDLSTTGLLKRTSLVLLPVNQELLEFCLNLIGKKALTERLCGSLQADNDKAKKLLGWEPPLSVDEGLKRAADSFKYNLKG